ncbi:MAG: hypothetical protein U0169_02545 [Polyangiaceae bacterium]
MTTPWTESDGGRVLVFTATAADRRDADEITDFRRRIKEPAKEDEYVFRPRGFSRPVHSLDPITFSVVFVAVLAALLAFTTFGRWAVDRHLPHAVEWSYLVALVTLVLPVVATEFVYRKRGLGKKDHDERFEFRFEEGNLTFLRKDAPPRLVPLDTVRSFTASSRRLVLVRDDGRSEEFPFEFAGPALMARFAARLDELVVAERTRGTDYRGRKRIAEVSTGLRVDSDDSGTSRESSGDAPEMRTSRKTGAR